MTGDSAGGRVFKTMKLLIQSSLHPANGSLISYTCGSGRAVKECLWVYSRTASIELTDTAQCAESHNWQKGGELYWLKPPCLLASFPTSCQNSAKVSSPSSFSSSEPMSSSITPGSLAFCGWSQRGDTGPYWSTLRWSMSYSARLSWHLMAACSSVRVQSLPHKFPSRSMRLVKPCQSQWPLLNMHYMNICCKRCNSCFCLNHQTDYFNSTLKTLESNFTKY